jgi:predicted DNA-binding WGR domain protein
MAIHHGGKVGNAGKTLAKPSSSKSAKSKAAKTLVDHKNTKH